MQLDFTAILGSTVLDMPLESSTSHFKEALSGTQGKYLAKGIELDLSQIKAITEAPRKQEQAANLAIFYQREQQELDRAREVYTNYQENIRAAANLRADILKGLQAGEAAEGLLLKACNIISLMTGDKFFYSQSEADLLAIYGEGMGAEQPLRYKLEQVQERLKNMQQALTRELEPDNRRRIERAITAHKAEADRLQSLIKKQ